MGRKLYLIISLLFAGTALAQPMPGTSIKVFQGGTWTNACTQSGVWVLGANSGVDIGDVTINNPSLAVTGTFWQATQPVSGTLTCNAGTNLNTSALALESGGNLATIAAKDFATQTTLATRLSESDFDTKVGSLTESAPGTDTASSGLNGRLQRIAQRLTSLIALLPSSLTGSGNLKVSLQESNASQAVTYATTGSGTSTGAIRVELPTNGTGLVGLNAGTQAIGRVGHDTTAVNDGRKVVTTAGTRVALASSTSCKWVTITAETDNTGLIVVGSASTVVATLATRQGTPLYPGDSITIITDNLADIGLDSTVSGDGVTFTYGS